MSRLLLSLLLVTLLGVASGCGDGTVSFRLEGPAVQPEEDGFTAVVAVGCDGDGTRGEVSDLDIDYVPAAVTLTFSATEPDTGQDCSGSVEYDVELDEELGARRVCDGSSEPPRVVQRSGAGPQDC